MKIAISVLLLLVMTEFVVIVCDLKRYPQCLNTDNPIACTCILKELMR